MVNIEIWTHAAGPRIFGFCGSTHTVHTNIAVTSLLYMHCGERKTVLASGGKQARCLWIKDVKKKMGFFITECCCSQKRRLQAIKRTDR